MLSRNATARRELLGAAALLLALAVWCPRTEGQGAPKQSAKDDLTVLRSIFPANQPVNVRLRTVPPGQPEVLAGVRIEDVVDLLGARFVRFKDGKGAQILVRSAQIYAIESGGSAGAPKVGKGSFTLSVVTADVTLKQGEAKDLVVTLDRKDGFKDAVEITVQGLPAGVLVESAKVAAGAREAVVTLKTAEDAKDGSYELTLRGTGGDAKAEARVKLRVVKN
jgi:hypothetical protein